MTEQELVSAARAGDADAFEALVRASEKRVYNLALRLTGSPEDALDLSQEAFLNAWRGLSRFHGECAFSTWMYRLTSNVCLDFLRARQRRLAAIGAPASLERDGPPVPSSPGLGPEERLERKERAAALRRALDKLPERQRQVVVLRELAGLSYQEISQALDLDMGTVKSRLTRGRLALKRILLADGNFFEEPSSIETAQAERR